MQNGFGDKDNIKNEMLRVYEGNLYALASNQNRGGQVWSSSDGFTWRQVNPDGFGDSNNNSTLLNFASVVYNNNFYIGTTGNNANGGEIWQMEKYKVHLPFMKR